MEGRTQTSIIPKIEKDGLIDREGNLSEIRNMKSNNNKEVCQKEADTKGNTKAAKYSVRELPKSKNQKEDNKLKLNPHSTSYVPAKKSNNEEMYNLLINMIQQQAASEAELECFDGNPLEYKPLCRSIQRSSRKMDSKTKGKAAKTTEIYKGRGS